MNGSTRKILGREARRLATVRSAIDLPVWEIISRDGKLYRRGVLGGRPGTVRYPDMSARAILGRLKKLHQEGRIRVVDGRVEVVKNRH